MSTVGIIVWGLIVCVVIWKGWHDGAREAEARDRRRIQMAWAGHAYNEEVVALTLAQRKYCEALEDVQTAAEREADAIARDLDLIDNGD